MKEPPSHCPWELSRLYVRLTTQHCVNGSFVLQVLRPPLIVLTASRIAGEARQLLHLFCGKLSVWGPYSTPGAGVAMQMSLGLSMMDISESSVAQLHPICGHHGLRILGECPVRVHFF